jgi:hypothetical protein
LAAAKEMSRGNTVLYNNAATDGVRAGALAAFGSQMQTFEWLRQKRGDAPAQQEFLGVIDNGQGKSSGSRSYLRSQTYALSPKSFAHSNYGFEFEDHYKL